MIHVQQLARFPFLQGLPAETLRQLAAAASEHTIERGEMLVHQHDEAQYIFLLEDGVLQFLIQCQGMDDLLVGTLQERGSLLGWSVFRPPYRYTTSVRCEERCRFIRLPRAALEEIVGRDPRLGLMLLRRVAAALADRIEQTRDLLVRQPGPGATASAGA